MKLNRNKKQSSFGLRLPSPVSAGGGSGDSRGGFRRPMGQRTSLFFSGLKLLSRLKFSPRLKSWACILLLTCTAFPQSENTISNDGTTNHFWYVGKNSSARLGVGVDHKLALPNSLTLGDSLSMGSLSYIPGWAGSGWKLEKDSSEYTIYIDNLNIRGTLSASELLINQVKATNGNLLVTSAAKVDSVTALPVQIGFKCEDVTGHALAPFLPGDIIMCQAANMAGASFNASGDVVDNQYLVKRLIFQVDSVNGLKVYKSNLPGAPPNKGKIKKGDTFVRIGSISNSNRRGLIGLYTDEPGAPFIQIKDKVNSWSAWKSDTTTRVYLGNLSEISDNDFGGQLEGYGLYSNNAYIKGKIIVTNPEDFNPEVKWDSLKNKPAFFNAPSGQGLFISATNMGYYNSVTYPGAPWRTYMDNLGRFYLTGTSTNYLSWDGSTLNINGSVTLTNTIPLAKVSGAGVLAGANSLDNVPDGTSYAKVLKTDIQAGHIKLSSVVGTIDDISNGTMYGKVLLTDIQAGHIKLIEAVGNLDDIDEGTAYGKILKTDISAGHIRLSEAVGTLDDIDNGSTYGKILSTEISAGHIKIVDQDGTTTVIDGGKLQTNSISTAYLSANAITSDKIAAGAVTAGKLSVGSLSAISANLGTITAGSISGISISGSTITGGTFQTATTGQRVIIDASNQVNFYGSDGNVGSIKGNYLDLDINALVDARIYAGDNVYLEAQNGVHISNGSGGGNLFIAGELSATRTWVNSQGYTTVPSQTGNGGKFLTTNGTSLSWANVSGAGAVTSIGINTGTGLTVSSSTTNPITSSGTFTISIHSNYALPTTNQVSTWNSLVSFPGFGTTSSTACVGNDSRLSDSRPASDVYGWAKSSSKPSYSFSEIGSKPTTLSGYGITDAASFTHGHAFSSITSKPSTLSGYGISDTYYGSLGSANLYVASTSGGTATTRLQYYPVTIGGTLHYLLVY